MPEEWLSLNPIEARTNALSICDKRTQKKRIIGLTKSVRSHVTEIPACTVQKEIINHITKPIVDV